MHPWPLTLPSRSLRILTLLSSGPRLLASLPRTSKDGGLPSTRQQRWSTVLFLAYPAWSLTFHKSKKLLQRGVVLKLPDYTRRYHAESHSTLQGHQSGLAKRLQGMCHLFSLRMPTLVYLARGTPVSLMWTCRPLENVVVHAVREFQVAHLIDSGCPNRAAETRWEDLTLPIRAYFVCLNSGSQIQKIGLRVSYF